MSADSASQKRGSRREKEFLRFSVAACGTKYLSKIFPQKLAISGKITTAGHHKRRHIAGVKLYGEELRECEFHPDSKCADATGDTCEKQTVGLLQRRHIRVEKITPIGKESNKIEEVASALIHSGSDVYTEYVDPRCDQWETTIRPALNKASLGIMKKMSGLSPRMLVYARTGRRRPHQKHRELIAAILQELGLI